MRFVKQKNDYDCGIAVAAMLCGVSWAKAVAVDEKPEKQEGLTTKEFLVMCVRLGRSIGMVRSNARKLFKNNPQLPGDCVAILVKRPGASTGHYAAIHNGYVYDPSCKGPVRMSAYRRRRWKVWRVFVAMPRRNPDSRSPSGLRLAGSASD